MYGIDDREFEENLGTAIYAPLYTENLALGLLSHKGYQYYELVIGPNQHPNQTSYARVSYYVITYKNKLFPYIDSIYIDKNYTNRGLGSLLLNKACDHLKSLGFSKVYAWYYLPHTVDGQDVYPFLNAHGFKTVSKRGTLLVKAL